jgi:hypothetical protein
MLSNKILLYPELIAALIESTIGSVSILGKGYSP